MDPGFESLYDATNENTYSKVNNEQFQKEHRTAFYLSDGAKVVRIAAHRDADGRLALGEVQAFQREIGYELPGEYVNFLLKYNGGYPRDSYFREKNVLNQVVELFPLSSRETVGLRYEAILCKSRLPEGFIAIGRDIASERILLALTNADYAKVFKTIGYTLSSGKLLETEFVTGSFFEFANNWIPSNDDPLQEFARTGTAPELEKRISSGFDVNTLSRRRFTLICEAIAAGNAQLVAACIKSSARLEESLHVAIRNQQWEILRVLLNAGSDPNSLDRFGELPINLIFGVDESTRREVRELLVKYGSKIAT